MKGEGKGFTRKGRIVNRGILFLFANILFHKLI